MTQPDDDARAPDDDAPAPGDETRLPGDVSGAADPALPDDPEPADLSGTTIEPTD
ncbi:hypothetical protein [Actinoplanes sp. NPDC049802]|uniref:hypothetical protein n=1 Tax=Actinoplanes sp. NPDC049802 TaxID=3154742 RepID=UPI003401632B